MTANEWWCPNCGHTQGEPPCTSNGAVTLHPAGGGAPVVLGYLPEPVGDDTPAPYTTKVTHMQVDPTDAEAIHEAGYRAGLAAGATPDLTPERHRGDNVSYDIRCPECGSTNVECVEKPHHDHICHDCGHTVLPNTTVPTLVDRIRSEADQAARAGQCDRLHAIADEVAALVRSAQNDTDGGNDDD